jgi:hypothetical protein
MPADMGLKRDSCNRVHPHTYDTVGTVTVTKIRRLEWAGRVVRMDHKNNGEESVSGKARRKKETRKTKVKMAGLCGG